MSNDAEILSVEESAKLRGEKRKRILEPCRKCGKPTKYGPGNPLLLKMNPDGVYRHVGVLCSACLKIEGPKALEALDAAGLGTDIIDRTTEPTTNNATGWTDDPNATVQPSPPPCSQPCSPIATEKRGPSCPSCNRPMRQTETGFRCEPCTKRLGAADGANCVGCDYNEGGTCTIDDDEQCPITRDAATKGPRGPFTAAEETRERARGELAAEAMCEACAGCGAKNWTWTNNDRRGRIGIELVCSACSDGYRRLLTRPGLYEAAVSGSLVAVVRDPSRAFYRLARLEAVAITENADHDVLTFRAGGETQCFPVEDADPVLEAIVKLWGKP